MCLVSACARLVAHDDGIDIDGLRISRALHILDSCAHGRKFVLICLLVSGVFLDTSYELGMRCTKLRIICQLLVDIATKVLHELVLLKHQIGNLHLYLGLSCHITRR